MEFSVNDPTTSFTSSGRHSYEALLRQLLSLPSRPAVVLLHHYPWWKAAGDGLSSGLFYREPEGQLNTFSYVRPDASSRFAAACSPAACPAHQHLRAGGAHGRTSVG